jgi:hypothetical protein
MKVAQIVAQLSRPGFRRQVFVAPVSRPAVLRASWPSETSPHLQSWIAAPLMRNAP